MKTAYAILALVIVSTVFMLSDTDHGSKQAFSDSIRAAGQFAKR
jgi:hypothetical protein